MSKWHPREHSKALRAMQVLTLEERGAYNTCLDLIYEREGPIPDDPRWLAGWMGVSVRRWGIIRAALIVKGKLFEISFNGVPSLMNERAIIELESLAKRTENLRIIGAKGGNKSAETRQKDSKNNDADQANAQPPLKLVTVTSTEEDIPPVTSNEVTAPRGAASGFDRFWAAYPRKTQKDAARKAWSKAAAKADLETMLAAIARQREWEQWQRGVIPHPATWLNQARWEDQPAEIIPLQPRQAHERPSPQQPRFERHAINMAACAEGFDRMVERSRHRRGDGDQADGAGKDWPAG